MGKLVEKFQDLECWKKSRLLVNQIYKVCEEGKLSKDYTTNKQLKSAALSIMNNITEGFGRFSKKEFARFLNISIGSAYEVKSMIYVMEDLDYLSKNKIKELHFLTDETIKISKGLLKSIRRKIALKLLLLSIPITSILYFVLH